MLQRVLSGWFEQLRGWRYVSRKFWSFTLSIISAFILPSFSSLWVVTLVSWISLMESKDWSTSLQECWLLAQICSVHGFIVFPIIPFGPLPNFMRRFQSYQTKYYSIYLLYGAEHVLLSKTDRGLLLETLTLTANSITHTLRNLHVLQQRSKGSFGDMHKDVEETPPLVLLVQTASSENLAVSDC